MRVVEIDVGSPRTKFATVLKTLGDGPPEMVVGPPANANVPDPLPASNRFSACRTMSPPKRNVWLLLTHVAFAEYWYCQLSSRYGEFSLPA